MRAIDSGAPATPDESVGGGDSGDSDAAIADAGVNARRDNGTSGGCTVGIQAAAGSFLVPVAGLALGLLSALRRRRRR